MTSITIYCTYLTTYSGNKLPPFYIGSTYIDRVNSGYHGSVRSKKYKEIWDFEIKNNPHLFKTKTITKHIDRKDATAMEYSFQKLLRVVKSPMYINESLAATNGCFGRDVSGSLNPAYKREYKPTKATRDLQKQQAIESPRIWVKNDNESIFILESDLSHYLNLDYEKGRSIKRIKPAPITRNCSCIICRREIQLNNIGNHWKYSHSDITSKV